MKIGTKILTALMLTVMVVSTAIGYAAIADNLTIHGDAQVEGKPYEGVYITAVEFISASNGSSASNHYVLPTTHKVTARGTRTNGSVTYKITVFNNTNLTYWYIGPRWDTSYGDNSLIDSSGGVTIKTNDHLSESSGTFNQSDWIPPGTTRDFYVTYTFGANAQKNVSLLVNFHFGIRMDAVHDDFLAILNDTTSSLGYYYLENLFDQEYKKDKSTTIDSVNNADVFAALFGDDLTVDFNGVEQKATVVIERKNMDNRSTGDSYDNNALTGCEYTVYITVEDPKNSGSVIVYAISYSKGKTGSTQWYQIGQLYEGTATTLSDGTFSTSSWRATANTYTAAGGITYKIGQKNGDQYEIMKELDDILAVQDQNIFNTIDNVHFFKKIYDILKKHTNSTDPAVLLLQEAFVNASPYYVNYNNGQEFKVVRSFTKAEIVPVLEALQEALDYYYQAYPE